MFLRGAGFSRLMWLIPAAMLLASALWLAFPYLWPVCVKWYDLALNDIPFAEVELPDETKLLDRAHSLGCRELMATRLRIRSAEDLDRWQSRVALCGHGISVGRLDVDLNNRSLIGQFAWFPGHAVFTRRFKVNEAEKKITFIVRSVHSRRRHGPASRSANLVAIPKKYDAYKLEFELIGAEPGSPRGILRSGRIPVAPKSR
jgi:hypothetical protein